jgi:hypothetical protein
VIASRQWDPMGQGPADEGVGERMHQRISSRPIITIWGACAVVKAAARLRCRGHIG